MSSFNDFQLQPTTRAALASMEISEPTPIQAEAIPALLAGRDLVGQSATGSGKTLAYGIPLVERLSKERVVQALVIVPTRELAVQVNSVLSKLAGGKRLGTALLVGGRAYASQNSALRYGAQIIVGTPGRIKDHLDHGNLVLNKVRICVLDEADQMLDIGFAPVIEEILSTTPETRQMALFSATMPDWVATLQKKFLKDPVNVAISTATGGESTIEQIVYQVPQEQKMAALCTLLQSTEGESSLIFGRTKYGVEKLGKQLTNLGFTVGTLHGNKSQHAREEVLSAFRRGQVQTLLATNVAARGLDIKNIYQVINYELPESSDLFTHRIGRTGRMGQQGKAITLLVPADLPKWRRMTRSLGQAVSLQRLVINKDAIVARPPVSSQASFLQEPEESSEQWSSSDRKPFISDQERGRFARQNRSSYQHDGHTNYTASGIQRRRYDRMNHEASARQPEDFTLPELPEGTYSEGPRGDRRDDSRQSRFSLNRSRGKRKEQSFVTSESQPEGTRRKPRTAVAPRRASAGR